MGKKTLATVLAIGCALQLLQARSVIGFDPRNDTIMPITPTSAGDTTTISFDSGSQTMFNQASTPLTGGTTADGDGAVLQLGYFTVNTASFQGTWVPLSGEGSLNTAVIIGSAPAETYNQTSIGDLTANGAGDGTFAMSLNFILGSGTSDNSLPPAGTQLALRFYNGTTIGSSTFFNTVTDSLWKWVAPNTPPVNVTMSLDDANLVWQDIAFHTSIPIPVPEPSSLSLLGLGALGSLGTTLLRARHRIRAPF